MKVPSSNLRAKNMARRSPQCPCGFVLNLLFLYIGSLCYQNVCFGKVDYSSYLQRLQLRTRQPSLNLIRSEGNNTFGRRKHTLHTIIFVALFFFTRKRKRDENVVYSFFLYHHYTAILFYFIQYHWQFSEPFLSS